MIELEGHAEIVGDHGEPAAPHTEKTPAEQLDLATVLKVSLAASSELDLSRLMQNVLTAAVEHVGAERAVLFRVENDVAMLEAEAVAHDDSIEVRLQSHGAAWAERVLRYVIRTHESVLLGDASMHATFGADEYVAGRRSRSLLCVPLLRGAELVGALYLENDRTPHVFTAARHAILTLLASQATASLHNARLYADVQRRELAHVSRSATLGELAASIAHELNQPLAGIVTNASTCLRWLAHDPPELDEARETAQRIIRDGQRAAHIVAKLRASFRSAMPPGSCSTSTRARSTDSS